MKNRFTEFVLKFCGPVLTAACLSGGAPVASADDLMFSALGPGSSVETPLPALTLAGPNPLRHECHTPFTDPGARATGGPVAIAAGLATSFALARDGTVIAWGAATNGNNGEPYGESIVPAGLSTVVAIAAGDLHGLALQHDGTVVAWGYGGFGQTTVPHGLSNVVAIAGGGLHSLALKRDGTVVAWGLNNFGQSDAPEGLSNVVAIAGGGAHSLALKRDGTVVAWGYNFFGQTNVPADLSNVVAITGGFWHSLALKRDGKVVGWGYDLYGQTTVPPDLSNVVAIAGGDWHSLALKRDGTVVAWGYNLYGQTNWPSSPSPVVAIAGGGVHSLALRRDGAVVGWGAGYNGQTTVPAGLSDLTRRIVVSGAVDANHPGHYALTYSVTDLLGHTVTTNRTVVVVDTTPPALLCPKDLVISCVGAARVPVSFAPEAVDLCSGPVSVSCVPPSGSLFPIGTTVVRCTAADASGNTASCGFRVRVHGARAATADVVEELAALSAGATHPQTAKKLDRAVQALSEALDASRWRDDTHLQAMGGDRVFQQGKEAVNALVELMGEKRSAVTEAELRRLVECVVHSLRLVAVVEIEEAVSRGADLRKIAAAEQQLAAGDEDVAAGNWAAGIEQYRNAWSRSVSL